MGNCYHKCKFWKSSQTPKTIVLLLVGLDNAGKTSAIQNLKGESASSVLPTIGFSSIMLKFKNYFVKIYDLGGGQQIRGIWHRYFSDAHGVIFVVDASDVNRLDEGKEILTKLLTNEKIQEKPVLILANKQDQEGALDEVDIVERLQIEDLVNKYKCKARVETCSATTSINSKLYSKKKKPSVDPGILLGYRWLVTCIINDFDKLNQRVSNDMQAQKCLEKAERKARLNRISENKKQNPHTSLDEESDDENMSESKMENPFKPISSLVKKNQEDLVKTSPSILPNKRVILVKSHSSGEKSSVNEPSNESSNESKTSMTDFVTNQLKLSASSKRKRFKIKANKTIPLTDLSFERSNSDQPINPNPNIFTISAPYVNSEISNTNSSNSEIFSQTNNIILYNSKRPSSAKSLNLQKTTRSFPLTESSHNRENMQSAEDSGFVSPRRCESTCIERSVLTFPNRPKSAANIHMHTQDTFSPAANEKPSSSALNNSGVSLPSRSS